MRPPLDPLALKKMGVNIHHAMTVKAEVSSLPKILPEIDTIKYKADNPHLPRSGKKMDTIGLR